MLSVVNSAKSETGISRTSSNNSSAILSTASFVSSVISSEDPADLFSDSSADDIVFILNPDVSLFSYSDLSKGESSLFRGISSKSSRPSIRSSSVRNTISSVAIISAS